MAPREQVAAIPWKVQDGAPYFLLVRTKGGGRWTFPKGDPEPPPLTDAESARKEAEEEAGATGLIEDALLTQYGWPKYGRCVPIDAYLLRVTCVGLPPEPCRDPTWCSADDARRLFRKNDPADGGELERVLDEAMGRLDPQRQRDTAIARLAEPDSGGSVWPLLSSPPVAGMAYPDGDTNWRALADAGYERVLALHDGSPYECFPLHRLDPVTLQDQVGLDRPTDPETEWPLVAAAVQQVTDSIREGVGIIVHCCGGKGRTGTILACALRDLGVAARSAREAVERRGGYPESPWQRAAIEEWPHRPDD